MTGRGCTRAILATSLAVLSSPTATAGPRPADEREIIQIRQRVQDVLAGGRIQDELPAGTPGAPPPGDSKVNVEALAPLRGIAWGFAYVLLAAAAVVAVVGIWLLLAGRSAGRNGGPAGPAGSGRVRPGLRPGAPPGESPDHLATARRLGAAGQYQEAAHLMLLGAIEHLAGTPEISCRDSHTSREVLRLFGGDHERKLALAHLVAVVEQSLFGGRPVTIQGYESCRRHLDTLLGGGAP